mmetsp:Transcript_28357/g.91448  ORF Transcript_28357/g.91448 Transcript_28357/m.91448 type:complete len:209 (+) Transcript_28357:686-1312(+)
MGVSFLVCSTRTSGMFLSSAAADDDGAVGAGAVGTVERTTWPWGSATRTTSATGGSSLSSPPAGGAADTPGGGSWPYASVKFDPGAMLTEKPVGPGMAWVAMEWSSRPVSAGVQSTLYSSAMAARYFTTRSADGGATDNLWAILVLTHSLASSRASSTKSVPYLSSNCRATSRSSGTSVRRDAQTSVHIASRMSLGHSFSDAISAVRS